MHKILFSVLLICAMVCCKGIDLRMHRGARSSPKVRNSCGILTCTQTNNVNDSYSTAVNDRASPGILFSSIQRMSLFISKGERIAEIGSITETSPILKSVVNGKKTEGLLEPGRATMRLELVKEDDCMADFICDVHGLDNQGKQVLSSISLKQHFEPKQTGSQTFDPVLLLNSVQQIVNSLEAKIEKRFSKLEKDLEYKSGSLYRKLDRKILELQKNVNNRSDKSDIMISQLQDNLNSKIGSLENVTELQNKTQSAEDQRQFFESDMNMKIDRIEDKLGSCNRDKLNKLNKIDAKVSKVIAMFDDDTVKKRLGFVADLLERSTEGQREVLENFTQTIQQGLNNASLLFTSVKGDIDRYGQYGLEQLAVVKNRTDMIYDTLTFEEVPTPCLKNNTSLAVQDTLQTSCYRNMSNASTQNPPVYVTMMDLSLKRDILCDTKTDGGGWVVIQRRTNGDVDFYRNWENYKNGFGSPPGDFWLGNEAVHNLTSSEPYELRIDLDVDGQNHFAVYSSFKIENEIDNYRLRLGSHSGTLEEESASSGFSYCNGLPFSTYDKDNDEWPRYSDAEYFHGAWWYMYKYNSYSNLNGKWDAQNDVQGLSWFTGHSNLYASKTEMKIRLLYK